MRGGNLDPALAKRPDSGLDTPEHACALVDELGPSAIGEIVVWGDRPEPRGAILVEGGRVCWAAARGLARRLTELLVDRAAVPRPAMESLFVACRSQHIPLGEHLVDRGILKARDLREALLQHTVESLRFLCHAGARGAWTPRSGPSYRPYFTFPTALLLAEVGASSHDAIVQSMRPALASTFGGGGEGVWGAAFLRSASCAGPELVAVEGAVPHTATALLRLGRWAASSLDVSGAFTDEGALVAVTRKRASRTSTLVAFRHGDGFIAGETGPSGPARIMNLRAQERRKRGNDDGCL